MHLHDSLKARLLKIHWQIRGKIITFHLNLGLKDYNGKIMRAHNY